MGNKEGVLAPNEKQIKKEKAVKKVKRIKIINHRMIMVMQIIINRHKMYTEISTMIPVLAHRSTWSEASDTIFQLNVARQQQYQATKDLEESLKSREVVKSWYEEKIAVE